MICNFPDFYGAFNMIVEDEGIGPMKGLFLIIAG